MARMRSCDLCVLAHSSDGHFQQFQKKVISYQLPFNKKAHRQRAIHNLQAQISQFHSAENRNAVFGDQKAPGGSDNAPNA